MGVFRAVPRARPAATLSVRARGSVRARTLAPSNCAKQTAFCFEFPAGLPTVRRARHRQRWARGSEGADRAWWPWTSLDTTSKRASMPCRRPSTILTLPSGGARAPSSSRPRRTENPPRMPQNTCVEATSRLTDPVHPPTSTHPSTASTASSRASTSARTPRTTYSIPPRNASRRFTSASARSPCSKWASPSSRSIQPPGDGRADRSTSGPSRTPRSVKGSSPRRHRACSSWWSAAST